MRAARLDSVTWVRWLAVLALLVHAGLVARHNAHALAVDFASLELRSGSICKADLAASQSPLTEHERLPIAADTPCPICCGTAGGLLPLPSQTLLALAFAESHSSLLLGDQVAETRSSSAPPPNRGPPRAP